MLQNTKNVQLDIASKTGRGKLKGKPTFKKMIISYKKKFIFIHVPKCAGISISTALKPYGRMKNRSLASYVIHVIGIPRTLIPKALNKLRFIENRHIKARDIKEEFGGQCWNSFYTFGIVRNPWDWEVSHYHYILKSPKHQFYNLVCSMKDFEDFVYNGMRTVSSPNVFCKFLLTNGELDIDFVARFETLDRDFETICVQLNLSDGKICLPHRNKSNHTHYSEYYNEKTVEIVRAYHVEDIKVFNYEYESQVLLR